MSSQEDINPDSSPDTPPNRNSKDAFFEPKPQAKIIRVLTVMAYVLSVSMTAILLSIYYIFMWDGGPSIGARVGVDFGENNFSSETVKIQLNPNYNLRADPLLNSFYFTKINRSSSMLDRLSEDPKGKNDTNFSYSIPSEENSTYEASTEMQQQFTAVEFEQLRAYSTPPTMTDENSTFPNDYESLEDLGTIEDMSKNSPFIKKLMGSNEEDY